MKCSECEGKLEIHRVCMKICMKCNVCNKEYDICKVFQQLDCEIQKMLEQHSAIIL
jgi:hypothetical protein